jgi:Concanavalin A-like lectin/glucanases superfamily
MSPGVIILGAIIIFLVYILYYYLTNNVYTLQNQANFNTAIPGIIVKSPQNTRYAYGIWIYVNSWNAGVNHTIFSRANNLRLYLDQNSSILKLDMVMNNNTVNTMTITDNFPLQKWVNIIISVDNQFVDAYLNGKLIQSMRFFSAANAIPAVPPDATTLMYVGNSDNTLTPNNNFIAWDAYATLLNQWSGGPIDPQTAWSTYLKGNGSSILGSLGNYGANIQIMKNNIENSNISLF